MHHHDACRHLDPMLPWTPAIGSVELLRHARTLNAAEAWSNFAEALSNQRPPPIYGILVFEPIFN